MPSKPTEPKPGSSPQPATGIGGWLRKHWRPAFLAVVVLIAVGVWWDPLEGATTTATPGRNAGNFQSPLGSGILEDTPQAETAQTATAQERADQVAALESQLELAEETLCSYRVGTKYPPESRPIAEHPDQIYPNQPVEEVHAMRIGDNKSDASVQIKSSQTRVYVASGEAVVFTVKAMDPHGKTLPLFVTRAVASGITPNGSRIGSQVTLSFSDDGINGDAVANDGTFSGLLAPGATGFASFNGTIRAEVKYNVGDRPGSILFDIIYTSETPATWAGPIREVMENGSLHFYLKADVRLPGRYLVSGRVDDAKGKPFALVTFNEVLGPGPNDISLPVVGNLIRDQEPVFPLKLRDVEAYLLKEDTDPDRALMPRLIGTAYVTAMHAPKSFSEVEWQSEERSRYLAELGKDVSLAKKAIIQHDPEKNSKQYDCMKTGELR